MTYNETLQQYNDKLQNILNKAASIPTPEEIEVEITENGELDFLPEEGTTFSRVRANVNVWAKGDDGVTFIPSVSEEGVISWTNTGDLENPEPVDITGDKGDPGLSAYDLAKINGYSGTEEEWLNSLKLVISSISTSLEDDGFSIITFSDGSQISIKNGSQGMQGIQGIQGPKGDPFFISKVYSSIAAMNNDYDSDEVKIGQFVVIETGNVEDEDNAKLFIKGNAQYEFLTDLSGAQGMQGPQGIQGIQGIQGNVGPTGNGIVSIVKTATNGLVDTYTITFSNGESTSFTVTNGAAGASVTVTKTTESSVSGGSNTVTFSDGKTLTIKNGGQGETGERGFAILKVTSGPSSYTTETGGFTPSYRISLSTVLSQSKADKVLVGDTLAYSYYQYPIGYVDSSYVYLGTRVSIRGAAGTAGAAGESGYTPQREVDYWTPADQEAIVQQVIAALGTPVFGRVDEYNNIILSGDLAEGTYTLKYENEYGEVVNVGTIIKAPDIENQIPLSINADGSQFVGENGEDGYKIGYRINSSGTETAEPNLGVTGYIPIKKGDVLYFKNCKLPTSASGGETYASNLRVALYKSDFSLKAAIYAYQLVQSTAHHYLINNVVTTDDASGFITAFTINDQYGDIGSKGYIRIGMGPMDGSEIITINKEV